MTLICMDRRDTNLNFGSKQHHFVGVDIVITGGGNHPPSDAMLQKVAS